MDLSDNKRRLIRNIIWLLAAGLFIYVEFRWPFYKFLSDTWWYFWAWLTSVVFLILIFLNILVRLPEHFNTLLNELRAVFKLSHIGKEFIHLHNISFGRVGTISHIVIGPSGIWVAELRDYKGEITFKGDELAQNGSELKGTISHMLAHASIVQNFLRRKLGKELVVYPVMVIFSSNATIKLDFQPVRGVYVVYPEELVETVQAGHKINLDENLIGMIVAALKKSNEK